MFLHIDHFTGSCPDHCWVKPWVGSFIFGLQIESFSRAIEMDPFMAIAFQMRGLTHYNANDVLSAGADFLSAFEVGK